MILDTVLVIEAKNAKNNYLKNYVNSNLTENDIIFEENSIKICGNTVGSYKSSGSYHIVNSYLYSESDMLIICKAIAKHMGDEDEYQRLYDEWLSHNYGYYAFSNNGIFGFVNKVSILLTDKNFVDSCIDVDFRNEPETGIRAFGLFIIRYYASRSDLAISNRLKKIYN